MALKRTILAVGIGLLTLNAAQAAATTDEARQNKPRTAASHWSFQKVTRPPLPSVTDSHWVPGPIDRFVLARLERRGWKPAPQAMPAALLRRLHLALTGLPPSLEEQDSFLKEPTSEALDRVVDNLLGRPQYGER